MAVRLLLAGLAAAAAAACNPASNAQEPKAETLFEGRPGPALERFASARAFDRWLEKARKAEMAGGAAGQNSGVMYEMAPPQEAVAMDAANELAAPANPEITNNQTIGVDEGGIVKQVGRFLVTLQDARLFTIDLGTEEGAPLRLADRIDVYRSSDQAAEWYDEMLVHGRRILVTAYSYRDQASEISVFDMGEDGRLTRSGRFLLSSEDYYSTENYATRLVGDNLVFYAPQPLPLYENAPIRWPRLRRAEEGGEADAGEPMIGPTDVYAPIGNVASPVLHTLSVCPLKERLQCRTTAFVGPWMRELYVSPTDAFLWVAAPDGLPWSIDYGNRQRQACPGGSPAVNDEAALLYRVPLDGGAMGAVAVDGSPADQFAFESSGGRFRALLGRAEPGCRGGDAPASLTLLDLPLTAFGDRVRHVSPRAYAALPRIEGGQLENRFVGGWLVYGGRTEWSSDAPQAPAKPMESSLFAVPLASPAQARRLTLPHNAIRIERAGSDAVVTGYRDMGGLSLSYVALGAAPRLASTTQLAGRVESENRSHAFSAWIRGDGSGLIGLATSGSAARSGRGWSDSESSDLSFVAVGADKSLSGAGELTLRGRKPQPGYSCEVSCIDWYGNSRAIFTGGRIFALMGTELVEGRIANGRIAPVGRVDLTGRPALASAVRRPAASRR